MKDWASFILGFVFGSIFGYVHEMVYILKHGFWESRKGFYLSLQSICLGAMFFVVTIAQ
jgi:hypothetical protein